MAAQTSQTFDDLKNQTLIFLAFSLSLIALIRYLSRSKVPDNIPPFPVRPYPFVGHLPYLKNGMRKQLNDWTNS